MRSTACNRSKPQDAIVGQFAFIPGRLTLAFWPDRLGELLARANLDSEALQQASLLRHFHVLQDGAKLWTLLTYAFIHGSWSHVGLNSIWIIAFGPPVARRLGAWRFLASVRRDRDRWRSCPLGVQS